jgi:hypothetical protein
LTTVDSRSSRPVIPSEPRAGSAPTELAATDEQLPMVLHDSESDYHAVLAHPWADPRDSSGALVVATTDSASVFGLT